MAQLVVLYNAPTDRAAFEAHYADHHVPLARKIPGMRRFETSAGPIATPTGPSKIYMIATLTFDDMAAIQAAFASQEGQAAAADVPTFATGGAEMLMFDTRAV